MRRNTDDMRGWTTLMCADGDGLWAKRAPDGSYLLVRVIDLYEYCGEREIKADGADRFNSEVLRVALAEISPEQLASAISSCGWDGMPDTDLAKIEACVQYGCAAPLFSDSGKRWLNVRASARREAESYMRDADALESALDKPCNAIGTTAREFGQGNVTAGLSRYLEQDKLGTDPKMDTMALLYGLRPNPEPTCEFGVLQSDGSLVEVRRIKQSDLRACPHCILVPSHYREDGSCKCDDAAERARMIVEWEYSEEDFAGVPLRS